MALHHVRPTEIKQRSNDEAWTGYALFSLPGAIIGYFIGNNRLNREAREGKTLSDEPTTFNRGAGAGAGKGALIGGLIATVAFFASGRNISKLQVHLIAFAGTVIGFFSGSSSYNAAKQEELIPVIRREHAEAIAAQEASIETTSPQSFAYAHANPSAAHSEHAGQGDFLNRELQKANDRQLALQNAGGASVHSK